MTPCICFLNELSYESDSELPPEDVLSVLLSTLGAARKLKKLRDDVVLAGSPLMTRASIGNHRHSLATLLRGDEHKEEWRFLTGLQQSSPWEACPVPYWPHEMEQVMFENRNGVGLLWARKTNSFVLSIGFIPTWNQASLAAKHIEIGAGGETTTDITIPNIANVEHVDQHRELIVNYGRVISASSLVFTGDDFVIRMFFDDHDPPHFHVMSREEHPRTIAKYRIDFLEVLEGQLPARIRKTVIDWALERQQQLLNNWDRCRRGEHPAVLP
jgi:hypothetical protein